MRSSSARVALLVKILLIATAGVIWIPRLDDPRLGHHAFRQAMMASNIEKFLENKNWLVPALYNKDHDTVFFDFPLYQWCAVVLSKGLPVSTVVAGRLLNAVVFAASLFVLDAILVRTGIALLPRLLTLVFFSLAPLTLYYYAALMPDPLATLLSFASLASYLRWEAATTSQSKRLWYGAMTLAAVGCLLIKNPIYLPVLIALLSHRVTARGWRSLFAAEVVMFGLVIVATILAFKLISATVNQTVLFPAWERYWFFSNWEDRTEPRHYVMLAKTIGSRILNPLTGICFAGGILWMCRQPRRPARALYLGWMAGCVIVALIFFNLHRHHDYYQIPFVFPFVFFAAYFLGQLAAWLKGRLTTPTAPFWIGAGLLVVLLVNGFFSWKYYHRFSPDPPEWLSNGLWIREHTDKRHFVIYVMEQYNWDPTWLYYARRDGFNLGLDELSGDRVRAIWQRFRGAYRACYVFVPASLVGRLGADPPVPCELVIREPSYGALYGVDGTGQLAP